MLLSVDHGNKFIKTPHTIFTSGLYPIMSEQYGTESLKWEQQHFALSEQRIPYMYDKTIDDRYFVLTLFALVKELLKNAPNEQDDFIDVTLLAGLPPKHYGLLNRKFEQYFRERLDVNGTYFEYQNKAFFVKISNIKIYPQDYAAVMPSLGKFIEYPRIVAIDIGGFTAGCLVIRKGCAD